MKKIVKIVIILVCIIIVVIGGYKGGIVLRDKMNLQQEQEREWAIESTLRTLGNRSLGSHDFDTAQYSMALMFVEDAALGVSNLSNLVGLDEEKVRKESFKSLESYFESDYLKSYAALIFGSDYFVKEDIEYFYNGTKVNASELKTCVEELMSKDFIGLSSLLINDKDTEICFTISLRVRLAEDGYMTTEDIVSQLYRFVFEGDGIVTVSEDILAKKVTYEQIAADATDIFSGEEVHFNDLSTVGKMVFLYLMPRYVVQFDETAGSELWYFYFEEKFDEVWEKIIHRDMFFEVIEQ